MFKQLLKKNLVFYVRRRISANHCLNMSIKNKILIPALPEKPECRFINLAETPGNDKIISKKSYEEITKTLKARAENLLSDVETLLEKHKSPKEILKTELEEKAKQIFTKEAHFENKDKIRSFSKTVKNIADNLLYLVSNEELLDHLDDGTVQLNSLLIETTIKKTFKTLKQRKKKHDLKIKDLVSTIVEKMDLEDWGIIEFTIGRTNTSEYQSGKRWIKSGISSRWNDYRQGDYDFLLAFAVLTIDEVPEKAPTELRTTQQLTVAIEQAIIKYFAYVKQDQRLGNTSFIPGNLPKNEDKQGVIYMAVKTNLNPSKLPVSADICED